MRRRPREVPRYARFPANWRQLVERGQPFITTGAARCRLTLARVEQLGEATDIILKDQVSGDIGQATLAELVRCLGEEGATWYMAQHAVPACLDAVVPARPVTGVSGLRKPNIWLGSARAFTGLHQDVLHNCILQLDGVKQFTIFAPEDDQYLYREATAERANYSQIPLTTAVDRKRFPAYRKATPYRLELRPRDVLVLPAYWWHEVLTLEASLMLNYWWAPTLASVRGIAVERQIYTGAVARHHVMKHLDLSGLATDHALVDALCRQRLGLFAALVLGDMVDELLLALAAKHRLAPELYPRTCEALLETRGVLAPGAIALLKEIRGEAATAETALARSEAPRLTTPRLHRRLRELCAAQRVPACRRMVRNNATWMKQVSANSYLY